MPAPKKINVPPCFICRDKVLETCVTCADCRSIYYCGEFHKIADWPRHKEECKKIILSGPKRERELILTEKDSVRPTSYQAVGIKKVATNFEKEEEKIVNQDVSDLFFEPKNQERLKDGLQRAVKATLNVSSRASLVRREHIEQNPDPKSEELQRFSESFKEGTLINSGIQKKIIKLILLSR